ncbi:MAG TPA: SHOCT domain-containing protein [Pseudonocardiaceae bacterium]|jgi:putative membrane protein
MSYEEMSDMMHGMMGWGWLGAIFSLLILLLVAAVLTAGLIYLLRALWRPPPNRVDLPDGSGDRALQILNERYARGEINHDDYEQRRRVLGS